MIVEKNKSKINDSTSQNNTVSSRLKKDLDTSISNYKKNKTTISLQDIFKKLGYSF